MRCCPAPMPSGWRPPPILATPPSPPPAASARGRSRPATWRSATPGCCTAPMADSPLDILRRVFGFASFRGDQATIIDHVMAGGDSLVLMPTGGGKSLCYQIPALCRPGIGIVVSPLIALMQDQVEALRQLGVRAAALNSTLEYGAARAIERQMREGRIDLVYVAPERLLTDGCLDLLDQCRI